jgi:DNA-directed RNA polymerase specialized sigma24 family protein
MGVEALAVVAGTNMVSGTRQPTAVDWDAALRAHNARVVASLLAMSVSIEHAEELASQTWTRLIEQERGGQLAEVRLPGLAITQARFLALNWLKARQREAALPADMPSDADPERALIARRDVATALGVIATCSESAQAVFRAIYDHPPPSHEAVAARVGLSVQRVRQILCEVRKRIRHALEQTS